MNTRWRLHGNPALDERPEDYSATFEMQNVDTDSILKITITQRRGGPATDLVGALRATAALLEQSATSDEPASTTH